MLKIADKKLEKLGFTKLEENKYGATYSRYNNEFNYGHKVAILHKKSGRHILQSYDSNLHKVDGIYINEEVGLTYEELKWFARKMKELGLNREDLC